MYEQASIFLEFFPSLRLDCSTKMPSPFEFHEKKKVKFTMSVHLTLSSSFGSFLANLKKGLSAFWCSFHTVIIFNFRSQNQRRTCVQTCRNSKSLIYYPLRHSIWDNFLETRCESIDLEVGPTRRVLRLVESEQSHKMSMDEHGVWIVSSQFNQVLFLQLI